MKAILLAAGLGSRLKPITEKLPKCLVDINGVPLLCMWIDKLFQAGVERVLINTHYLSEMVVDYIDSTNYKNKIDISYEPVLLGTAGTLLAAKDFISSEHILMAHADNLTDFNVMSFYNAYKNRPKNCLITMMVFHTDSPSLCGIVNVNEQGVVIGFEEKPKAPTSNLANAAVYIFDSELLDFFQEKNICPTDFSTEVIPLLIGRINTYLNANYHRDIGSPESLAIAQIEYKQYKDKN